MNFGIGTDIVDIERIEKVIARSKNFVSKVYTEKEILYCEAKNKVKFQSYAGKFAGKEAVSKALGTGVSGFSLKDIEIINNENGKPIVVLSDLLKEKLKDLKIEISISHEKKYAIAFVLIQN